MHVCIYIYTVYIYIYVCVCVCKYCLLWTLWVRDLPVAAEVAAPLGPARSVAHGIVTGATRAFKEGAYLMSVGFRVTGFRLYEGWDLGLWFYRV